MSWIVIALAAVAFITLLKVLKPGGSRGGLEALEESWPFYMRRPLTEPEQVLYFRLSKALPDHIILSQVQLSRLLGVKKGNNYQAWSNRINRLSADFVVCNRDSSVVAVIELDDASHQREDRKRADAKKDKALTSAGIPVIRWKPNNLPDEMTIKQSLLREKTLECDFIEGVRVPA